MRARSVHPSLSIIYSRLCHNPYPIKCILLENSHRFERRKDSHVHKPSFVHGWFHFRIISPWNRFPWTPPNGPEWVWVMTESTVYLKTRLGNINVMSWERGSRGLKPGVCSQL